MSYANSMSSRTSEINAPVLAGTTVSPINPVALDANSFVFLPIAATGATQFPVAGFPESTGAGTKVEGTGIFTHVNVKTTGRRRDGTWSWSIGRPIYLSRTAAGGLTQAAPNVATDMLQQVAIATATDELMIQIGQPTWV